MIEWDEVVPEVAGQVVKIENQNGWGTGFVVYGDTDSGLRTIAIANHVIENAYGRPLTIVSDRQALTFGERSKKEIMTAQMGDLDAVTLILIHKGLPMPVVPLLERDEAPVAVGMEIGWLGFPRIAESLCFFSGRVSTILNDAHFLSMEPQFIASAAAPPFVSLRMVFGSSARSPRTYPTTLWKDRSLVCHLSPTQLLTATSVLK